MANKFENINTNEVVRAMQLPKIDEDASEELVEWLYSIEPHDDFFESGYDGALIIHNTEDPVEAPAESWIIQYSDKRISYLSPEAFLVNFGLYSEGRSNG